MPDNNNDDEDCVIVRVTSRGKNVLPSTGKMPDDQGNNLTNRRKIATIRDNFSEDTDNSEVRERQLRHRQPREKTDMHKKELMAAIKKNRFCASLEVKQLATIVDAMEFFSYQAGEIIVNQGENGSYFFVMEEGVADVIIDGTHTNTLEQGQAFGGVALIYNCPRTATVKAKSDTGAWGVHRNVFRRILREHTAKHNAENRTFFQSLRLFDGLSPIQQQRIGEMVFLTETHEKGKRVVTAGEKATAIYFVRRGELSAISGGTVEAHGGLTGGTKLFSRRFGDCFGERAVFAGSIHRFHIVADTDCELVCVAVQQLGQVLGEDNLGHALEQSLTRTVLKQLPLFSHIPPTQLAQIMHVVKFIDYDAGSTIDSGFCLIVPIHGEVTGANADGTKVTLGRGEPWHVLGWVMHAQENQPAAKLDTFMAGSDGARVATLTKQDLQTMLNEIGIAQFSTGDQQRIAYMRKLLLQNKVPVFLQMSTGQIEKVLTLLVLRKYTKGARCFTEGEAGSSFYILSAGEVQLVIGGEKVRTLKAGTSFGERSLLLDEPRNATVEVASDTAELWSITRADFQSVLTKTMQRELVRRLHLNDTSITLKGLRHVRLVGVGSFGSVRLVENSRTAQRYALKRVKKEDGEVPDGVMRECELLGEVDHPSVLRLVKTFETDSSIYILTELITGGELYELLRDRMGRLSRKHTQFYVASIVAILQVLHESFIVHRDLKPENVMLDQHGYLKLVDFGMAKKGEEGLWRTHTLLGTPLYIAPEMLVGKGYGFEVDIWALGVMMYELATGFSPFGDGEEDTKAILQSILDDELRIPQRYNDQAGRHLITGLLCKDPLSRLGAGINGWEDVKNAKFFRTGVSKDLFIQISGREMQPPIIPEVENYCDEEELNEIVTLSDAEELDPPDLEREKMLKVFRQFDIDGDGKISRDELGALLKILDPNTFTESAIDILLNEADWDRDGKLNVEEFVAWLSASGAAGNCFDIHG